MKAEEVETKEKFDFLPFYVMASVGKYSSLFLSENGEVLTLDQQDSAGSSPFGAEMEQEIVLLGFWTSPYVMRVKIALLEKGIQFQYREEEDIFGHKNESDLLLNSNSIYEKVPVLIHNGKPICESLIILQYIDEVWKHEYQLHSDDAYSRAMARFWIDFFDKKIADCGRKMWASKGEEQDGAKKEFIECLKLLENELGDKLYFEGDHFGLLDIALIPITCRFYTYEMMCKFSVEEECPKFMEWVKRCSHRESVSKTLPDPYKVYDFVLQIKKRFGIE